MRFLYLLLLTTLLLFTSCGLQPGSFWTGFNKEFIEDHRNDQGPWGGKRSIHWKLSNQSKFNKIEILEYAELNDWILIEEQEMPISKLQQLKKSDENLLQLRLNGFEAEPGSLPIEVPIYFNQSVTMYRFKTSWLMYYPGTDNSTLVNGIILLSNDQKEMTLYHVWGE